MSQEPIEIEFDRENCEIRFTYRDGTVSKFIVPEEALTDDMIENMVSALESA